MESTTDVHELLAQYAEEIRSSVGSPQLVFHTLHLPLTPLSAQAKGALLLAVVGAKLSEGLNFSDDLARMVMVIGLPFANLGSAELQERLKHADRLAGQVVPKGSNSAYGAAGKELYENMCMNSVNQSIGGWYTEQKKRWNRRSGSLCSPPTGRAIRHKNDWSMLVLVDMRYRSEKIHGKLPKWIEKSLVVTQSFGQAIKASSQFFASKREG